MHWNNVELSFYFPIKPQFIGSNFTINNSHSTAFTYNRAFRARHANVKLANGTFGILPY